MSKLHRIIYQEILPPSLIALAVLTFVVFTREFGRLAELLIRGNAPSATILEVIGYLLPSILIYSVPMAFLIGTLIGFSRLSSDSEIIALRSGGVSTWRMVWPVLKIGLGVVLITGLFTFFLLPEGNWKLREIRHLLGVQPLRSAIKPHVFNEELPGVVLYVQDVNLRTGDWRGVFVAETSEDGAKRLVLSKQGEVLISPDGKTVQLHFEDGMSYQVNEGSPDRDAVSRFRSNDLALRLQDDEAAVARVKRAKDKRPVELIEDLGRTPQLQHEARVELNNRVALPLSALVFAVLGVTLGINTRRGGRGYGFVVSIVVAFTYYVLFATGTELSLKGVLPITLGVWGANLLLGAVALYSFRYAERENALIVPINGQSGVKRVIEHSTNLLSRAARQVRRVTGRLGRGFWVICGACSQFSRVIDLFVLRNFIFYMLPTLAICIGLFYMFTFFQLIDDIFAHEVPYSVVADYFFYLLPQILLLLVPIAILIGTLITFGVLDKTSQIVGFKSCGVSIYRLTAPILVIAVVLSGLIFLMQEHLLPYANQRQDALRDVIKGRPVQTYFQPGRSWIFGGENRLYNYRHFDAPRGVFANISIFDLDLSESQLVRHIYAQRAVWDPHSETWRLYGGWSRTFEDGEIPYETFDERTLFLPERPAYFQQEVKQSSKMTYPELREYIAGLQRGGFEVDQLKTELHKKISFPVVNLIMAVLGIPFAFSMGRKGALYGIAVGVLIGILYWGLFGVFGVLGENGLLSPILAAWGPNIIFSAGGTLLLSTVRT
jgi:LPS export ABC transporter permease LptG/LPS export ABC transporter permease LptF